MSGDIISLWRERYKHCSKLGTKGENWAIVFVIDYYDMSGVVK